MLLPPISVASCFNVAPYWTQGAAPWPRELPIAIALAVVGNPAAVDTQQILGFGLEAGPEKFGCKDRAVANAPAHRNRMVAVRR
jgi:hypothetical protein